MEFLKEYERCRALIDQALDGYFTQERPYGELLQAMRYSLLAGGKRIRPMLVLKFCQAAGGDPEAAMPFACAVEMLHTYSLIHDDLPCMDNDELRRGKPTNHVVYGECTATLAGDALQAAAFRTILSAGTSLEPIYVNRIANALAEAAGPDGICGGQYLDMDGESKTLSHQEIALIHEKKTAALLSASCLMGVFAAGEKAPAGAEDAARGYAAALGLAFQIKDDILDCTSTVEVLGKPIGSDAANHKNTFVSLLGIDACEKLVAEKTAEAKNAIQGCLPDSAFLCELADWLANRSA